MELNVSIYCTIIVYPVINAIQKATRNNSGALIEVKEGFSDTISFWIEAYFQLEITTSASSQKVQCWDLTLFRNFLLSEVGSEKRRLWSPRLSKAFKDYFFKLRKH